MSSTLSMLATNSPLFSGGITQPFTFQGLSSFFLKHLAPSHGKYFRHNLARPFYPLIIAATTWHTLLVDHYSINLQALLLLPHQLFFHIADLIVFVQEMPLILLQRTS